jgi:enoyl-CoA hydratase
MKLRTEVRDDVFIVTINRAEVRSCVDRETAEALAKAFGGLDADDSLKVAGGLELSVWRDLYVAARDAIFGVYCRRWGVPLVDGGKIRLPRLIGQSHAMDIILTGRGVSSDEAVAMGLVNRLVEPGEALSAAIELAREIESFPQLCMQNNRRSVIN